VTRTRYAVPLPFLVGALAPAIAQAQDPAPSSAEAPPESEEADSFEGVRPFVGATLASGPSVSHVALGNWTTFWGMLFSLRGGVLLGRTELSVEIAPVTYLPLFSRPTFAADACVGHHFMLGQSISWPLRAGLGIVTVNTNDAVWLHGRVDVVGLSFRSEHALVDVNVPSFRISSDFDGATLLSWMFGFGVLVLP
jgi:hypothetical protein